jgi:hypothetical protein
VREARIREALEHPERHWLSVASARAAGACRPGIEAWARRHAIPVEASHRLDLLLELDPDNSYLRLACAHTANS